jgi:orotate phosphoribosyltransferase
MDVRKTLEEKGCIFSGHFVGTSGKHLAGYFNMDPIFPHAKIVKKLVDMLIKQFAGDNVETVAAAATAAIPLSQWGAYLMEELTGKPVMGVWADKTGHGGFVFERDGFVQAVRGKRVLILEDIVNQMHSVKKVKEQVEKAGGEVVGIGSVAANKGVSAEALGVPKYVKLCTTAYDTWTPEDCKKSGLCARKVPIVEDIGHGDEFKAQHPDYKGGFVTLLT